MTDLSALSDDELKALYSKTQSAPASPVSAMSDEELRAAHQLAALGGDKKKGQGAIDFAKDVGRAGAGGLIEGGLAIPYMSNALEKGVQWGLDKILGEPSDKVKQAREEVRIKPEKARPAINEALGTTLDASAATTPEGKKIAPYVQTAAEFLPMTVGTGGSALTGAVIPGLASEGAGQYAKGSGYETIARLLGGLGGGIAGGAAGRAVTPIAQNPARQRLVDVLNDEGVTSLTAGQRTGNKTLQYAESILGDAPGAGQGASRIQGEGQRQFTEATMRRAGQGLPDATPEVLAQNNARLGQEFRDLSARNNLVPDNHFITDLVDAARNYRRVPDSQQRAIVQGYIDDIIPHVNAGSMPGAHYQEMRSRLSRQANSLRQSDPTLSEALRDMRNALDEAMGRSISPADREAWQLARREYGAQKTIEKAASRAGEATAEGQIVPANLRNAVSANNRGAYARGEGDFSELARAGSGVMAPLPNSGTGQRLSIWGALNDLTGGAIPAAAGRALMSRPGQAYLANQLIGRDTSRDRIARALLSLPSTLAIGQ